MMIKANLAKAEATRILNEILRGAKLSTFEYWSEFNIRFEIDEHRHRDPRIPPAFHLRLRSDWWVGQASEWDVAVQQFPLRARRLTNQADLLRASKAMQALGSFVDRIIIDDDMSVVFITSDQERITVPSLKSAWDESWILELPADDPKKDEWIIICDNAGRISARIPSNFAGKGV